MKKYILAILILFALYYCYYATISGANVVWLSWFGQVPMMEKFVAGTWIITDAVETYAEHGMFGYKLLLLLNLNFFSLNVFFDTYLVGPEKILNN